MRRTLRHLWRDCSGAGGVAFDQSMGTLIGAAVVAVVLPTALATANVVGNAFCDQTHILSGPKAAGGLCRTQQSKTAPPPAWDLATNESLISASPAASVRSRQQ